ncbi:MAG: glycoside hydrolase family 31 protein [Bacteroidetes bacterium]|nr:glycoside hydrolase family 31 protein [Bacteroidota bacterium]
MKKYFVSILLLLSISFLFAQKFPDNSLGRLKSIKKGANAYTLETSYGVAKIMVYSPEIIRFRISKESMDQDFSYAVVGTPQACKVSVHETEGLVLIQTDSLRLEISTDPVRFTVKDSHGNFLNRDDPAFGTTWVGEEVTTFKSLMEGEKFIGLGEKTGNLDRRGEGYTNWNSDVPGYPVNQDPIYASFPFYIGIHDLVSYGIFLDNTFRTNFNFGASNNRYSSFGADAGEMDYYFIGGNSVSRIIENYSWLTGRMPMPPLWGLGFQQSRWSYFPDTEVLDLAKSFREKKIPLDVIYLDIHYMDAYKIFTWHPERFSKPKSMIDQLKNMGVHTAVIVDPGIKVEDGYKAYEDGKKQDIFLKYPDGTLYTAQVWPGWCNFPDFTNPAGRKWWGDNFKGYVDNGVEGFWNDMNEVASWGGGKTSSIVHFNWEGKGASYRQGKNIFGMQMARSTYEGTKSLMNKRPLILTRAAFSGAQRYTAIWTGDNVASEEHMMLGCRLVNSLGITGMPFCGTDVGGFMTDDASASLFSRWLSIGTFTPFFRVHKHYDFKKSEPWSYGPFVEGYSRNYISLRYRLLPYIYSSFYETHSKGIPVNRALVIENTFDKNCWSIAYQNQFMFGPSLLIAPVESTKEITKVYLPKGDWYDFFNGKKYSGEQEIMIECPLDKLPVFAKGSSFIPMQSIVQNTSESSDTLFLHFFMGNEKSEFNYYEDDGISMDNESGKFMTRKFSFDPLSKQLIIDAPKGSYKSKYKVISLVLHGDSGEIKINGKAEKAKDAVIDILTSLADSDPLYTYASKFPENVRIVQIRNLNDRMVIDLK